MNIQLIPSYLGLRIKFNSHMINNNELVDPKNYTIVTKNINASDCIVIGVTPENDVTYPSYVDLECSDLTHGKIYELIITPNKLINKNKELLVTENIIEFKGVSVFPLIQEVKALTQTTIQVVFSKDMADISDLEDESRWSIPGLTVNKSEKISSGVYLLTTSKMVASQIYQVSVS